MECLSYSSPVMELFELALCWCGYEECNINFNLFHRFIHAYVKAGGQPLTDYETIYDSNYGSYNGTYLNPASILKFNDLL
ncbi:MAG: hypothetical protein J1E62_10335, partial [Lachnospiraceae bacterium]|nr:hypothetical protein [Lachnospiraceae bacterium]